MGPPAERCVRSSLNNLYYMRPYFYLTEWLEMYL